MSNHKTMLTGLGLMLVGALLGLVLARPLTSAMQPVQEVRSHQAESAQSSPDAHGEDAHHEDHESDEGRTTIGPAAAETAGLDTATAGSAVIRDTVMLYGTVRADEQRVYDVNARFDGLVREVKAGVGDRVRQGDVLAVVENNDSLQQYPVHAPTDGVILTRHVNRGESADGVLFTLADLSVVWVDFAAFPQDRSRISEGQSVHVIDTAGVHTAETELSYVAPVGSPASQSVLVRAVLPNPEGGWTPGLLVMGEVTVARREVPVAVRAEALQTFRESPVVFAKSGDTYEVRRLKLGARDEDHVEVLDGIMAGTEYVTSNSYVIKADLLKSGASHAH